MPTTFMFTEGIIRFRSIYRRCFFSLLYYLIFKVVNHKGLHKLKEKLIYFENVHPL